jgi:hypothetical protein
VTRKIEFLGAQADGLRAAGGTGQADVRAAARIAAGLGTPLPRTNGTGAGHLWRRALANPAIVARLVSLDRAIDARLQTPGRQAWLERYRRIRRRARGWFP